MTTGTFPRDLPTDEQPRALKAPLVGREDVWLRILEALGRAQDGEGQCVHVVGEHGSGKSRLREELVAAAAARGVPVFATEARSHTEPLGAVLWLARQLLDRGGPFVDALAWTPREEERIRVHLGGKREDTLRSLGATEIGGKVELWGALRKALLPAAGGPLRVVVLEDLHRVDKSTRELLREVSSAVADHPVLLLLLEAPGQEPFPRHAAYVPLDLPPLPRDAARAFLGALVDVASLPSSAVEALLDLAGGNAFVLVQGLQGWIGAGALQWRDRAWRFAGTDATIALPDSVQALVGADLARLSPVELDVLRLIAVLGREAPRGWVFTAARELGRGRAEAEAALALLLRAGHVTDGLAVALVSAVLGEQVRAGIAEAERPALHRALAVAAEEAGADPELLAEHWLGAGDPARAVDALVALAERARAAFDYEGAEDRYEQALAELAPGDPRWNGLRERLADVLVYRGMFTRAEDIYAQLSDSSPAGPAMLHRRAWCALRRGRFEEATGWCKAAIAGLGASPEGAGFEALASLALTAAGRPALALEWVARGSARLQGRGAVDALRGHLHRATGAALLARGRPLDAAGEHEAAAEAFRAGEEAAEVVTSQVHLGRALARAGRHDMALALLRSAFEHETRLQNLEALAEIHLELAAAHLGAGNGEAATEEAMAGMALAGGGDDPRLRSAFHALFGRMALADGDAEGGEQELGSARDVAAEVGARLEEVEALLGLAAARAAQGDPAGARAHAERAHGLADESGASVLVAEALLAWADAAAAAGEVEEAHELLVDVLHTEHGADHSLRERALGALARLGSGTLPAR